MKVKKACAGKTIQKENAMIILIVLLQLILTVYKFSIFLIIAGLVVGVVSMSWNLFLSVFEISSLRAVPFKSAMALSLSMLALFVDYGWFAKKYYHRITENLSTVVPVRILKFVSKMLTCVVVSTLIIIGCILFLYTYNQVLKMDIVSGSNMKILFCAVLINLTIACVHRLLKEDDKKIE